MSSPSKSAEELTKELEELQIRYEIIKNELGRITTLLFEYDELLKKKK